MWRPTRGEPVPADALSRAHADRLVLASDTLVRLRSGEPLVVTALGQSNTVWWGGCWGVGCLDHHPSLLKDGWATSFMRLVNATWPHAEHALYNRARGGGNSQQQVACLASHLAPSTNLLLLDFDLSNQWGPAPQERFARTAAALPRRPLVVFLGLADWCPPVDMFRAGLSAKDNYNRLQRHCAEGMRSGLIATRDAAGESLKLIAMHYGQIFVSIFDALAPLVAQHAPGWFPPRLWTNDGRHGCFYDDRRGPERGCSPDGRPGGRSCLYCDAVAALLGHTLRHAAARATLRAAPPLSPLRADSSPRPALACHEWMGENMRAPRVLANSSSAAGGLGWHVSEWTHQSPPRRKPGLLSLAPRDTIELLLAEEEAPANQSGAAIDTCVGVTYLQSYEGMGVLELSCVAPASCSCSARRIDALRPTARFSLFRTVELAVSWSAPCPIRLVNLGEGNRSKLRLAGLHVRRRPPGEACDLSGIDVPGGQGKLRTSVTRCARCRKGIGSSCTEMERKDCSAITSRRRLQRRMPRSPKTLQRLVPRQRVTEIRKS